MLGSGLGGPAAAGAWIEDKGGSFGLHVRAAADPTAALAALGAPVEELARRHGLVVEHGRLVLELRPPGTDKGVALTALAAEVGTPSAVLFAGDDLGDLAAFAAVRALRAGGTPRGRSRLRARRCPRSPTLRTSPSTDRPASSRSCARSPTSWQPG